MEWSDWNRLKFPEGSCAVQDLPDFLNRQESAWLSGWTLSRISAEPSAENNRKALWTVSNILYIDLGHAPYSILNVPRPHAVVFVVRISRRYYRQLSDTLHLF